MWDARWVVRITVPALFAVLAFNSTSTTFYLRGSTVSTAGGATTTSYSTSTTYKIVMAGGETAPGTSTTGTSFMGYSGLLWSMWKSVKPIYTQLHFHWRNDDGSEAAATSATSGVADTTYTSFPKNTTKRIRISVSNEGGTEEAYAAQQFRLEYGLRSSTCSAISSWTDVGAVGGDWDMANSTNLTNGGNTSNIATGIGGTADENHSFKGLGAVLDTSSQTAATTLRSDEFIEFEYSVQANTAATDGGTYCFRVTDAGTATNYIYTTYGAATIAGGGTLTLTVTTNNFTTVTPGTAAFATTTLDVTATNATGWTVYLSGDNKDTTNQNFQKTGETTIQIPDQTEWVPGAATTSAGNAVRLSSLANGGSVAAFRLMSASGTAAFRSTSWWGSADNYADSASTLWSGIPSTTVNRAIGNSSVTGSGALNTVLYYLNPPSTQKTGAYTAPLTYTVVNNP